MYLQNRLLAILCLVSAQFIGCTTATAITLSCNPTDLALPSFPDLQITTLLATSVHNLTAKAQSWIIPPLIYDPSSKIDFCNVTILYTHPGQNDSVTLTVWLPLTRAAWTGRFLGQGGGGWKAGDPAQLSPVVSLGYASASTDAGRNIYGTRDEVVYSSKNWSLRAKGEVNRVWLENFASRALGELAVVGKAVVKAYYGEEARFSYWHGCSTGGRQGMMLAQKFPGAFDGVLAAAPAINWTTFLVVEFWAQLVMKRLGYYPPPCELKAITKAAIEACDGLDGVVDGLVSAPGLCKFNATSVVGQKYDCEGDERTITSAAAEIANAAWTGPSDANGKPVWFGLTRETTLYNSELGKGLVNTICDTDNKNCKGDPFPISADWIRQLIIKDEDFDVGSITEESYLDILRASREEYFSQMDTSDPDLRPFQKKGGKIVSWHGLADTLIMPNGTSTYYDRVTAISPDVRDFYRFFEAPGVAHCAGGPGPAPLRALESLVRWVEENVAPEVLDAQSVPTSAGEPVVYRPLCPWPKVAAKRSGGPGQASSFACADSFDAALNAHDEL